MISSEQLAAVLPIVHDAYRYLHENPELGDQEFLASAYIQERLRSFGYGEFFAAARAPTAVITRVHADRAGETVALRCEIDARKIAGATEPAANDPRSKIDGVMHNCGHDIHAALLLGIAKLLQSDRTLFCGTVVFLFQPAEETVGGAPYIVADGILERLGVKRVFALHVEPKLPVGFASLEPGTFLAGASYFDLKLSGRGSHAAHPEEGSDMPVVAGEAVRMLTALPARSFEIANRPVVISVTKLVCDSDALNVISPTAALSGTVRAFEDPRQSPAGARSIEAVVRQHLDGLATMHGIEYDFTLREGPPPCTNDESFLLRQWQCFVLSGTVR